jgi:PIN domain nuclease of toxin-antitoxin system
VIIDDVSLPLCVSIISAWEIAIKVSIGKLKFDGGSACFLDKMRHNGIELLDVKSAHIEYVENLPFFHRDPFDRLLVATAKTGGMIVLTSDENIPKYDAPCVWL